MHEQYLISAVDEQDLSDHREQRIYRFPNGLGASVVRRSYVSQEYLYAQHGSYGYLEGLWELAVIQFESQDRWHITYATPITEDVLGWLSEEEVAATLALIQGLSEEGAA